MLVPSTLTGWYRKMMMNVDTTTDTTRSRSHDCITPPCLCGGLFSASCLTCTSFSTLSPYPLQLDSPLGKKQPPVTPLLQKSCRIASSGTANQLNWAAISYITGCRITSSLRDFGVRLRLQI